MKHQTKHSSLEQEQQRAFDQQTQSQSAKQFATVEEMLRYDAAHTTVPPAIATRLEQSTSQMRPPAQSWWRRVLGL